MRDGDKANSPTPFLAPHFREEAIQLGSPAKHFDYKTKGLKTT